MNLFPYDIAKQYETKVAYFSMEFAIAQALKIYSGGLGFLAGSHMRSVYDLRQHTIGIGILWSYGYYDQSRNEDNTLKPEFRRKRYFFLEDTGVKVTVDISGKPVVVKAFLLPAERFGTAPMILLSTDIDENDYLARTITHKLYDGNEEARIAQEIVLGIGGTKVLEAMNQEIDVYHLNEGHALPMVFELYNRFKDLQTLKRHVVFTTHTPEKAGNEEHNVHLLHKMGFFAGLSVEDVQKFLDYKDEHFSLTVGALKTCKISNGVSIMHAKVANDMWKDYNGIANIIPITNAQNRRFWVDKPLITALDEHENFEVIARKKHLKKNLFEEVADQTGKLLDPDVLTIVWARRFAEYKRPGLLKYDFERFNDLVTRSKHPIQVIWAGKPYPFDHGAIEIFNELIVMSRHYSRVAVLIKYELELSRLMKQGSDIWLNTPRITREASGTSGMTASMNGSVHFSISDGWHPEFCRDEHNSFTIPPVDHTLPIEEQDRLDNKNMMDILENKIIPMYYEHPDKWVEIVDNAMSDVLEDFDSGRMANDYYTKMYDALG